MRENKFRVWDRDEKKMIYHDEQGWMIDIENPKQICRWDGLCKSDVEIMQYTGFKDYNDKEIYEGDIIQCQGDEIPTEKLVIQNMPDSLEDLLCIRDETSGHAMGFGVLWEIIGNIYENPELIK